MKREGKVDNDLEEGGELEVLKLDVAARGLVCSKK